MVCMSQFEGECRLPVQPDNGDIYIVSVCRPGLSTGARVGRYSAIAVETG